MNVYISHYFLFEREKLHKKALINI